VHADVVEAQAIDQSFFLGESEQPWARIARLRARGNRAHFKEAKTHAGERVDMRRILVQACGKTHRVGELQAHGADWTLKLPWDDEPREPERDPVGVFGI
jgi:hypothetical protein